MTKLYFDFINDLFNSETAKRNGINNTTSDPVILTHLLQLVWYCLNPLRVLIGLPITVECAFRCKRLNEILKGAATGHPEGYCADLSVKGWTQEKLFNTIREFAKQGKIEYDQLIWEKDSNCLHIGYRHGNNRKQTMIRTIDKNGKFVYTNI